MIETAIRALNAAAQKHDELNIEGIKIIKVKSPVHETEFTSVLKGDLEAEEAVIDVFRKAQVPIRFHTEEHGIIDLSSNPRFLGTLDGIDGSKHYVEEFNIGRYATLLAIFNNIDPFYRDYLICGYFEHAAKRMMYAVKNQGVFLVKRGSEPVKVHTSDRKRLTKNTSISIDGYFDINLNTFADKFKDFSRVFIGTPQTGGYSGVAYADIAMGRLDLCCECTRKGNLELAMAYGFLNEAGGGIILLDGTNLGGKKFLTFGQRPNEHIPTIAGSSKSLIRQTANFLTQSL